MSTKAGELQAKGLVGVERWAELRREHFVRGVSIKQLASRTGLSRNTVRAALRASQPPRYQRAPPGSKLDLFKDEIHRLLRDDCALPGQRIRELIAPLGFVGGKTIVDDYLRDVWSSIRNQLLESNPLRRRFQVVSGPQPQARLLRINGGHAAIFPSCWREILSRVDLGTFFIDAIIVHDVPQSTAAGTGDPIVFSDVPSTVDKGLLNFFKERITRSLGRHAFEVERDPGVPSPVPELVVEVVKDISRFVAASRDIARHLQVSQTGINPAGLVIVCRGSIDGKQCCAILKLEREDAIRVEQAQVNGQRTFNVAYLRDLMLGRNTRVFKASLFVVGADAVSSLDGRVSDDQSSIADAGGGVASFFLRRFLGCRLKDAPEVATRAFFESTQAWIGTLDDPVKQGRYEVALIAQMNHQSQMVTPRSFADSNLELGDRQSYRDHLEASSAPGARFIKDRRLIDSKIKQMSIRFEASSVRVAGTPADVARYVRINPRSASAAPVEILDHVKDVRGGR